MLFDPNGLVDANLEVSFGVCSVCPRLVFGFVHFGFFAGRLA